jgi:hypothetical protein
MKDNIKRIPIARCPNSDCGRTLLFSSEPMDKYNVITRVVTENYKGKSMMCSRCKTLVAIIEKPKVTRGYVAIPIVNYERIVP